MRLNRETRELALNMGMQRNRDRARRRSMSGKQLMLGIGADQFYGVDESGRRVDLKVNIESWRVLVGFRRERASRIGEGFVEGDPIPSTTVMVFTDIYHAVRAMKHIRQNHVGELKDNEILCQNIDELHAMLYTQGARLDERRLEEIRDVLAAYNAEVGKTESGCKLLADMKMDKALEAMKEGIWYRTRFRRRRSISEACTLLTAFKNRYLWRDGEVVGIDAYEEVRENGLRAFRDMRLKGVLLDLAGKLEGEEGLGVACTLVSDRVVISAMRVAQEKIKTGEHDEALHIIDACGKAFKVDWFKGKLRTAYLYAKDSRAMGRRGWREEARKMLEEFARLLGQRNTRYILDELIKTDDAYMKGDGKTIALMEAGNRKIREAVAGDPLRRALAWVDEVKAEFAGTRVEALHKELILEKGDPKELAARKKLLEEAGRAFEQAAMALVTG